MTAQKWVWKHDLDQGHLDAIANHLIANTPGNVPTGPMTNVDPFTGGGAYRPGGAAAGVPALGGGGGGGGGSSNGFIGNADPLTGGSSYHTGNRQPGGGEAAKRPRAADAGASAPFATFDACKHDAVLGKLLQFNAQAGAAALDEQATARLAALVETLKKGSAAHGASAVGQADLGLCDIGHVTSE